MWSDEKLQCDVIDQLQWEPGVNSADIGVTVKSGVVTLSGEVSSLAKKRAIEKAVKRMPGVKAIALDIEIDTPVQSALNDRCTAWTEANSQSTVIIRSGPIMSVLFSVKENPGANEGYVNAFSTRVRSPQAPWPSTQSAKLDGRLVTLTAETLLEFMALRTEQADADVARS